MTVQFANLRKWLGKILSPYRVWFHVKVLAKINPKFENQTYFVKPAGFSYKKPPV